VRSGRIALCAALLVAGVAVGREATPGEIPRGPVYRQEGIRTEATLATWAVDPYDSGPSLPPAGRSLFDVLTAQRVPFPFSALLAELEARLGRLPGESSPLKAVLIPLGRSLQRNAGAPEFFRYPRVVVAVDTEAAPGAPRPEILLKDRLYLGYHEKAEILEVISYNEAAGRFEFQLVLDYRPGGAARVVYANRAVCTACHQGGGPLFARPLWDETNANPEIARLLAAEGRDFYGLPVAVGVDVPNAIDAATDRANRIAVDQLLWREGCGSGDSVWAVRCRAAAFTAALQRRLSGGLHHDESTPSFREDFLRTARRSWELRWPQGLAIPDPDVLNRNPLASHEVSATAVSLPVTLGPTDARRLGGLVQSSHVPALFEPLNPRPPLEVWTVDGGEKGPARLILGLADLLTGEDARRLDAALFAHGSRPGAPRERQTMPCEVTVQPRGATGERVKLRCSGLEGRVYLEGDQVTGGTIDRLDALRDLEVTVGKVLGPQELEIAVVQKLTGLHARRADGQAVERLHLSWREGSGEATVVFLKDFDPAAMAVQEIATRTAAGQLDAFSSHPFRRTALLGALFAELGLEPDLCCEVSGLPPPVLESGGTAGPDDFPEPAVKALYQYCGRCHATPEVSPPNFLHGDVETVRAHLSQCAERIFYRLEIWNLPESARPKTPMPPLQALRSLGLEAGSWPEAPDLALLRQHATGLLRAGTGPAPRLEDFQARGYENLRSCLSPVSRRPGL
jgi:hypothetical protein